MFCGRILGPKWNLSWSIWSWTLSCCMPAQNMNATRMRSCLHFSFVVQHNSVSRFNATAAAAASLPSTNHPSCGLLISSCLLCKINALIFGARRKEVWLLFRPFVLLFLMPEKSRWCQPLQWSTQSTHWPTSLSSVHYYYLVVQPSSSAQTGSQRVLFGTCRKNGKGSVDCVCSLGRRWRGKHLLWLPMWCGTNRETLTQDPGGAGDVAGNCLLSCLSNFHLISTSQLVGVNAEEGREDLKWASRPSCCWHARSSNALFTAGIRIAWRLFVQSPSLQLDDRPVYGSVVTGKDLLSSNSTNWCDIKFQSQLVDKLVKLLTIYYILISTIFSDSCSGIVK